VILLLVLLAVRVSVTPGVRHQHDGGAVPHHHGHPHVHPHPHRHDHEHSQTGANLSEVEKNADEIRPHIHISILGFEFTLNSPFLPGERQAGQIAPNDLDSERPENLVGPSDPARFCPQMTWGSLISLLLDLRSTEPHGRVQLPRGQASLDVVSACEYFSSRDRDKPLLPPPECTT
jgi:hypothetical protein